MLNTCRSMLVILSVLSKNLHLPLDLQKLRSKVKSNRIKNSHQTAILKAISPTNFTILFFLHVLCILQVVFRALRFAAPIQELGNRLARKIWIEGPYIYLPLRLEKNLWVKSGCLTGLGPEYDEIIIKVREYQP